MSSFKLNIVTPTLNHVVVVVSVLVPVQAPRDDG